MNTNISLNTATKPVKIYLIAVIVEIVSVVVAIAFLVTLVNIVRRKNNMVWIGTIIMSLIVVFTVMICLMAIAEFIRDFKED